MNNIAVTSVPNTLLGELERMRALAKNESSTSAGLAALAMPEDPQDSFSALVRRQVESVNATQKQAGKLAELFEIGDPDVSLVDVMIARQKSSVAFSALVEVRNKMLSAYQEVMNMEV